MEKQKKRHARLPLFILFFIIAALAVSTGITALYSFTYALPKPERIFERNVVESTKIFDRTGAILLYEIHGEEKRTSIPLAEVPAYVIHATIVAEDSNFYSHHGVDAGGIIRAILKNLVRGTIVQGGSTITQQLIKNSILTGERTWSRKFKELALALVLEQKYSKDTILELYLNQIPYGSNAYGIAAAAEIYFNKKADQLTIAEAATLASLPKAPTYYSPFGSHKETLIARRNWVLKEMYTQGYITQDTLDRANSETPAFSLQKTAIRAPHFVMLVRESLNQTYGETFVERGGLKVITTLDWKLQEEAEKNVREGAERNEKSVGAKNASLVALDPRTGEILAMAGSRDYFDLANDGNVNVALRPRQPGSAFKPFVYAAAFEKGYTPDTVLFDAPTEFNPRCAPDGTPREPLKKDEKCYHPQNYDETFRGPVTLRQAIAQSLNVPSVKLLYLAGLRESIDVAQRFGISTLTDPGRYGLSLVLGGAEVKLLEMTSAFGAFGQEGMTHPAAAILRVENSRGILLEEKKEISRQAISPQIARIINDVLSDNDSRIPMFNPRSALFFPDRHVAVKTGTTQDFRDAWVVGYTPSLAVGVWAGNNDNSPMKKSGVSVMVAAPLWRTFMDSALARTPPESFTAPQKSKPEKPILRGLYRTGPFIKIDRVSEKLATEHTPPELIEEKAFGAISTILSFVQKDDPLGNPPQDQFRDPQFINWEGGIMQWLLKNPIPLPGPPRDFDDIHTPLTQPRIEFTAPQKTILHVEEFTTITIAASASFPLREITFFFDEELIESRTSFSTAHEVMSVPAPSNPSLGSHRISVVIYDNVGNKARAEKHIIIE